ncbi:MAG: OsmC family protein [bacterium]|nr:OsmC family protein [bacterium]
MKVYCHSVYVVALLLGIILSIFQPHIVAAEDVKLATAKASAQLSNQAGRAIVMARGNHFVVDSVPPLQGPNEAINPLDLLLGALSTCGTFVFERAAQEQEFPLSAVTTIVEADFDPRGVKGEDVDPRIQAFRVNIEVSGIDQAQADKLVEAFKSRCPIFTTLVRSAPIDVKTTLK